MVTIDPHKPILNIQEGNKTASRSEAPKGEFDAVFRKMVDSTKIENADVESTHLVSDLRPAQFSTEPLPSTNMVVGQVERLIDTMEVYQQKLIENDATLKDVQTLVQKMASESESLSSVSSTVNEQDGLKTIIDQSLMLTSMEIVKFNSGHYNDPN